MGKAMGETALQLVDVERSPRTGRWAIEVPAPLESIALRPNRIVSRQEGSDAELREEVELAARVQQHLLRVSLPHFPPLDLAGVCQPCKYLAGDFFDFIDLDQQLAVA